MRPKLSARCLLTGILTSILLTFSGTAMTREQPVVPLQALIKHAEQSGNYSEIQQWVQSNPERCAGEYEALLMGYLNMKATKNLPKKTKAKQTLINIADAAAANGNPHLKNWFQLFDKLSRKQLESDLKALGYLRLTHGGNPHEIKKALVELEDTQKKNKGKNLSAAATVCLTLELLPNEYASGREIIVSIASKAAPLTSMAGTYYPYALTLAEFHVQSARFAGSVEERGHLAKEALKYFDLAVEISAPGVGQIRTEQAQLFAIMKDWQKCLDYAQLALKHSPSSLPARKLLAQAYEGTGQDSKAAEMYAHLISRGQRDTSLLENYIAILLKMGRYFEAEARSREAVGAAAANSTLWAYLGEALIGQGRKEEANAALEKAAFYGSRNVQTLLSLCRVSGELKKFAQQEQHAEEGRMKFPSELEFYKYLAIAQLALGKGYQSEKTVQILIEHTSIDHPLHSWAQDHLKKVELNNKDRFTPITSISTQTKTD